MQLNVDFELKIKDTRGVMITKNNSVVCNDAKFVWNKLSKQEPPESF